MDSWRRANPAIFQFCYTVEAAAKEAVENAVAAGLLDKVDEKDVLMIPLGYGSPCGVAWDSSYFYSEITGRKITVVDTSSYLKSNNGMDEKNAQWILRYYTDANKKYCAYLCKVSDIKVDENDTLLDVYSNDLYVYSNSENYSFSCRDLEDKEVQVNNINGVYEFQPDDMISFLSVNNITKPEAIE